ncbi:NEAT domain-containing protein [Lysinibacillus capsici]|uniref:NEAT domain-containing protein n=1 Tax=Lysinibacillus capsici TaxID=2115968 RepID=UPI002A82BEB2|nr:NEAT domain-containing protein [Lysinibacillus capsici]
MTLKRSNLCIVAIFSIIGFFFSSSLFLQVKAEEYAIADGSYQVELSFSQIEGVEENLFKEIATLSVKNGQYQITMALEELSRISGIHIEQLGNELSFTFDKIENLVQLDVLALQLPITIKGNVELATEEQYTSFSQELHINMQTLSSNFPQGVDDKEVVEEEEIIGQEWALDYVLLVDGKQEPSIMNSYVKPAAKVIEKDGKYYVQMTILQSAWVTGLKVDDKGKQVEPKQLSLLDNVRIVELEVEDLTQPIRMWVRVDIPDISYHHQYFVQLVFDEAQVAKVLAKPLKEAASEPVIHDKMEDKVVKEPVQKPSVQTYIEKETNAAKLEEPTSQTILAVPQEEKLAFDRTLDESMDKGQEDEAEENLKDEVTPEKVVNNSTAPQQIEPLNIVKIILLIVICLVSGWLLIRRLKKTKNDKAEQK